MKKIITFLMILLPIVVLVLIIVNPFQQNSSVSKKDPAPIDDTIHLKFGHNTSVDSALHDAAQRFADEVKRKTDSKVIIDIYPAQKLGNDHQMVEMAREGKLDILLTPTAKMSVAVPSMQYADLPFYFPTRQDFYDMLDGEPGQMILNDLKPIGLIGITFWENGFKHFTANTPLLRPEDFKDKKMRVMKSRIIMEQFKAFGAEPVAIDFYSTKQALHDKVVDGQENPLVAIVSMNFYKEQSDLTLSDHAYLGYVLSFSEKSFNKLPQDIQMILAETAKEITPWERNNTQEREEKLLKIIEDANVSIHRISEHERQRFAQKTAYIPQRYEDLIGSHIISKTKELLYNKYGAEHNHSDHILIGIDADISTDSKIAGLAIKRGAELAIDEINAKGGLLGKPVELIVKDNRAIASKGVQNIKEFGENKHLAAIISGVHGPVISAEIETIQNLKIPYMIPWAATAGLVKNGYEENYIFRVSANDNLAAKFITNYTLKKHSKPAIMVVNYVWGRSNLKLMKQYLKNNTMHPAMEIVFNRGQQNFKEEISKVIDSGADSIILVANLMEGSKIMQELHQQNSKIPVISHWGFTSGDFFKHNKTIISSSDLCVFQIFSFRNNPNEQGKKLLNSYIKHYGSITPFDGASSGIAQAYDIVHLLALAIKKAGTIEGDKVKEALENLPKYQGVMKEYNPAFTKTNHDALNSDDYYMAKYNKNGLLEPVK